MAYQKQEIINYKIQETAGDLYNKQMLDKTVYENILSSFPHYLYSPTLFLRFVGIVITLIGSVFAGGFVGLLISFSNYRVMSLFNGILSILVLELGIKNNKIYNAGTDNVLQLIAVSCFSAFLIADFISPGNNAITYFVIMLLCTACSFRYIDAFMALLANLSAVVFVVLVCFKIGNTGKMIAPLIVFLFSVCEYYILKNILAKNEVFIYKKVFRHVSTLSLLLIYSSLNYYVVCELNNMINNTHNTTIPFGILFWIATFSIPVLYIYRSIVLKNKTLLLTGIGCLVVSFISFRYYHTLLPIEWALFIVGILLILTGYLLIKFLEEPKNGFASQNIYQQTNKNTMLEAMIAAQVAASANASIDKPQNGTEFGGGSGGGGGASGGF